MLGGSSLHLCAISQIATRQNECTISTRGNECGYRKQSREPNATISKSSETVKAPIAREKNECVWTVQTEGSRAITMDGERLLTLFPLSWFATVGQGSRGAPGDIGPREWQGLVTLLCQQFRVNFPFRQRGLTRIRWTATSQLPNNSLFSRTCLSRVEVLFYKSLFHKAYM